jgi:conjugal transfer pilus assembly protein TraU
LSNSCLQKSRRAAAALLVAVIICGPLLRAVDASADSSGQTSTVKAKCPNDFPNLINDVCWKSLFPIKLGGMTILSMNGSEDNMDFNYNSDDSEPASPLCTCGQGLDIKVGLSMSFWEPARVIETVRRPYCFPFLFGMDMGDVNALWGSSGQKNMVHPDEGDKAFWNVHEYNFPLLYILQLIGILNGCTDWSDQFDLIGFSEADPQWNDDTLAAYLNPEAALFANPAAQALCATDCIAATAGWPLNAEFWCAGCWGSMYPFTGNTGSGTQVVDSLLTATRFIAHSARNGLPVPELVTSGEGAMCSPQISFFIKKSQYKFSMIYPIPMTEGKCAFPIGRDTITSTAEYRTIPATGEDYGWMIWKKHDCCVLY